MTVRDRSRISARALASRESELPDPAVEAVEAEIRSGISFPFRDALKRGVPADTQDAIRTNIEGGTLLGPFVSEWGYDVGYERAEAFHAWLLANEHNIANSCPDGVSYRGTYAVAAGERRESGHYRTIWAFGSFQALQDLSEALGDETHTLAQLLEQFNEFRDRDRAAPEMEWMLVPAAGARRF